MIKFQFAEWANNNNNNTLTFFDKKLKYDMPNSDATGQPLVSYNGFGADLIRFEDNESVQKHTHEGDHILFVLAGEGIVEYYEEKYDLYPGVAYLIPGNVPHAIYAKNNLILIAVGNNHRPVYSPDRLDLCK